MSSYATLFSRIAVSFVLMSLAAILTACGTTTLDRDASNAEVVQIDSFEVESPGGLKMGDEVTFTLRGTPGGEAVVLVTGVPEQVYLEEIDEGVYSGSLTVHPHMQFFPQDFARATLEKGHLSLLAPTVQLK